MTDGEANGVDRDIVSTIRDLNEEHTNSDTLILTYDLKQEGVLVIRCQSMTQFIKHVLIIYGTLYLISGTEQHELLDQMAKLASDRVKNRCLKVNTML